jgi:hypothetical protein
MDIGTLVKGLLAMTAAIAGIGVALWLVPPTIALTAVGLLLVGSAMVVIAGAIGLMGSLGIGTLVKGIVALAATLIVLAGGLTLMVVALPGAAALAVAALALSALVPVLGILGTMKWSTIFKGLIAIAAVMVTIGIAGVVAAPGMLALGIALIPLGLGLMLVATAAKIFTGAIKVLSSEGQKGFAVLLGAITGFVALLPNIIISFIKGLLSIADQIVVLAPKIVTALGKILTTVIAFIIAQAPKLALAIGALVNAIAKVLTENAPTLIATGAKLLLNIMSGISSNIGQVTTKAAEIIIKFLNALSSKAPQLVAAGVRLLTSFLRGVSSKIGQVVATVTGVITRFIGALTRNIPKIIVAGQTLMLRLIGAIAGFGPRLLRKGVDIIISFLNGIQQAIPRIKNKAVSVARTFVNNLADGLVSLANVGFRAIIRFLNGLARAIRNNDDKMIDAGANVADAIRDGLVKGLHRAGPAILRAAKDIALAIPNKFLKILGIKSPSKVFMDIGMNTMLGFAHGIGNNHKPVLSAAEAMGKGVIGAVKGIFGIASPSKVMREIGKEVGHGFKQGLDGSTQDIRNSFKTLDDKIKSEMDSIQQNGGSLGTRLYEQISGRKDLRSQLGGELKKKKPNTARVERLRQEIAESTKEIDSLTATLGKNADELLKLASVRRFVRLGLSDERAKLSGLSKQYADVSKRLEKAVQVLDAARQARDEAVKSYTTQFSALPDINAESKTPVIDYAKNLTDQIAAVKNYRDILNQLRELGLDDTTYKMLLEKGTAGTNFAKQLLAGGKGAVDQLNTLDKDLATVSKQIGTDAARNLYQAGVNAARGVVQGLRNQKANLEKEMTKLGDWIVRAIKKRLGIRSPSEEFATIAKRMGEGLAQGLTASTRTVTGAVVKLGDNAVSAMEDSMARISNAISANIDSDPVITPVLDLSKVERDAQGLADLTNVTPISAAASFRSAAAISDQQSVLQSAADQAVSGETAFNYVQNNYSPDPLSNIEIYRQTNNQLTRVKNLVGA